MKYLSICSGIEAATVAWHPLGWKPLAFSEIEPFPSAVLAHHWPDVPNLGDMTKHNEWRIIRPDLIVGGTPCQAFSVAGLRKGLEDPRGNLTLTFLAIVAQHRPAWVVWENVPGVLSDRTGAFGSFLGGLAELGYGWAYRVLDAQYFGVAQRRRRVFVVASLGGWGCAAAVLFERESLLWHPAPSRKAGKGTAGYTKGSSHWDGGPHPALNQSHNAGGIGMSNQELFSQQGAGLVSELANCLLTSCLDTSRPDPAKNQGEIAVAMQTKQQSMNCGIDLAHTLAANDYKEPQAVTTPYAVRRLTPTECERLQGFPDGHTLIPWRNKTASECPDGPRYKALGNSMAVPVMRWIGERIKYVETL